MVFRRSHLRSAPASVSDLTDAEREEAWARFEAHKPFGDWEPSEGSRRFVPLTAEEEKRLRAKPRLIPSAPRRAYERSGFGAPVEPDPLAVELRAVLPALPGTAVMLPGDIPLPPRWRVPRAALARERTARAEAEREAQRLAALARRVPGMVPAARRAAEESARMKDTPPWRDPACMLADLKEAASELPTLPARVTLFRAVSLLTAHGASLSPDLLDALAAGLGVDPILRRRDEALLVREHGRRFDHDTLEFEGKTQDDIAQEIGRDPRTVRRRKKATVPQFDWESASAVIASVEELVRDGAWDQHARLCLYDAARWFANRVQPIPVWLWWAIACAFGLATEGRFTDKAISAIWGAPTTNPGIVSGAAKLRASDGCLSNRELARRLAVDDGVVNRLASVNKHRNADTGMSVLDHAAWTERIWARWHTKA